MSHWKSAVDAAIAANSHRPESKYLQLATIRRDGRPAARTLVFRRFQEATHSLIFCTDKRSEKVAEMDDNPNVEACWYFPETRQQFRFMGKLRGIGLREGFPEETDLRRVVWRGLTDDSRRSFAWPAPGEEAAALEAFNVEIPSPVEPLDTFILLLLEPEEVDALDLRTHPHRRVRWSINNGIWTGSPRNP